MNNFSNIDTTRLCLIICLESINIENKNNILSNTSGKFKNFNTTNNKNDLKRRSLSSYIKRLSNMHSLLNNTKKRDQKDKIISILQCYSRKNRCTNNKLDSIFDKYIDRFNYKYIKYYKRNFINNYCKNNKNSNSISLIYLYILYKTLKTNNKFYIYKHLKSTKNEIKNSFTF